MAEFKVIETQEQLNEIIGERLRKAEEKARAEAEAKYADYGDLKSQNETYAKQIQQMQDSAAETEKKLAEAANYRTDLEKTRIAIAAGLKIDYVDRIKGENAEEWKADAELLARDFAASHKTAPIGSNEPKITKEGLKDQEWQKMLNDLKGE